MGWIILLCVGSGRCIGIWGGGGGCIWGSTDGYGNLCVLWVSGYIRIFIGVWRYMGMYVHAYYGCLSEFKGVYRSLWALIRVYKCLGVYGCLWMAMGVYRCLFEFIDGYGCFLGSMDLCLWGCMGVWVCLWISMSIYGWLWSAMHSYGYLWESMGVCGCLWKTMGAYGCL